METWRLADITYGHVKASPPYEVAVLPLGATEPHNLHLPYGTDTFQVEAIADGPCALADRAGGQGLALAGDPLRHRDQPDEVPPGHEPESLDARPG